MQMSNFTVVANICLEFIIYSFLSLFDLHGYSFSCTYVQELLVQLENMLSSLVASIPKCTEIYNKPCKTAIERC